jgi:D-methionine transport system ATP-binding protein
MTSSGAAEPIVRFESVRRAFGSLRALDGIDLEIRSGEIFGIIGRSGAGKSTLIRSINALERIDAGHISVEGRNLATLDTAALNGLRRRIGMIFQHFNLLSMKTVYENVELPMRLAGEPAAVRASAVRRMLDLVGLTDKSAAYPAKLSGGEKQRVGIARALINQPALLLSDEATSALDPETTLAILRLLKALNGALGVTIVLITHEMSVIREICDRVAVLDHGRIVESGPVWEIFGHARSEVARSLLGRLRHNVPDSLQAGLGEAATAGGRTLLRADSSGGDHYTAVLDLLGTDPGWQAQIVHADVDRIAGHTVGSVLFSIRNRGAPALTALLSAAAQRQAHLEVLGHVAG